ncbi:hypothetical protein [Streptomyces phaeoluteigriseus]|uniref:hypothetical protein n=1 Tax=Streptomyces phaeoluteigriseus TaxID=114686 RepID=UPI00367FF1BE
MNEHDGRDAISDEQSELTLQDLATRTEEEIATHLDGIFDADAFLGRLRRRVAGHTDTPANGSAAGGGGHSMVARRETGTDTPGMPRILIGSISGSAFSIGSHDLGNNTQSAPADRQHTELLTAVSQLRADLARITVTEAGTALDLELAKTAAQIQATGEATPGRLARLREALQAGGPVVELLASGAALSAALRSTHG